MLKNKPHLRESGLAYELFSRPLYFKINFSERMYWICFQNVVLPVTVFIKQAVGPRDVMAKVSKLDLQSRYYIHFRTNTLEKGMNPFIISSYG